MSSILTIPVTPLVLSLYNQCKVNMKCEDKSNTEFLILILNSATHIYSIVKEFSDVFKEEDSANKDSKTCENDKSSDQIERTETSPSIDVSTSESLVNGIDDTGVGTNNGQLDTSEPFSQADDETLSDTPPESAHLSDHKLTNLSSNEVDNTVKHLETELAQLIANVQMPFTNEEEESHNDSINNHFENYVKKTGAVSVPIQTGSKSITTRYKCTQCPATFSFKHGLMRHMKNKSCGKTLQRLITSTCPYCSMNFFNKKKLKRHVNYCPGQNNQPKKDLICNKCLLGFANKGNLQRHIKNNVCVSRDITPPPDDTSDSDIELDEQNNCSLPLALPSPKAFTPKRLVLKPKIKISFRKSEPIQTHNIAISEHNLSLQETSHTCSYCKSVLASRKGLQQHHREFRCRRKCTICDYGAARSLLVQTHLNRDHNITASIEDIDKYNRELYDQYMSENGGKICDESDIKAAIPRKKCSSGNDDDNPKKKKKTCDVSVSPKNELNIVIAKSDALKKCPVYDCGFYSDHTGAFHTHVKFHFLKNKVPKSTGTTIECTNCDIVCIPAEKIDEHNNVCTKMRSSDSILNTSSTISSSKTADECAKPKTEVLRDLHDKCKTYPCQKCDFVAKSVQSLGGHNNSHSAKNISKRSII